MSMKPKFWLTKPNLKLIYFRVNINKLALAHELTL